LQHIKGYSFLMSLLTAEFLSAVFLVNLDRACRFSNLSSTTTST